MNMISKRILKEFKAFLLPSSIRAYTNFTFPDKPKTLTVSRSDHALTSSVPANNIP